jgi:hypothetical protein
VYRNLSIAGVVVVLPFASVQKWAAITSGELHCNLLLLWGTKLRTRFIPDAQRRIITCVLRDHKSHHTTNNVRKEKRSSSKAKSLSLRLDGDGFEFGLLARLAPPFLH